MSRSRWAGEACAVRMRALRQNRSNPRESAATGAPGEFQDAGGDPHRGAAGDGLRRGHQHRDVGPLVDPEPGPGRQPPRQSLGRRLHHRGRGMGCRHQFPVRKQEIGIHAGAVRVGALVRLAPGQRPGAARSMSRASASAPSAVPRLTWTSASRSASGASVANGETACSSRGTVPSTSATGTGTPSKVRLPAPVSRWPRRSCSGSAATPDAPGRDIPSASRRWRCPPRRAPAGRRPARPRRGRCARRGRIRRRPV